MSNEPPSGATQALLNAWADGDEAGIVAALRGGADPNIVQDGLPFLVAEASLGREAVVEAALHAGADPDVRPARGGPTALMISTACGASDAHARIRDQLLEHGADVNVRDNDGHTAMDLLSQLADANPGAALAHAKVLRAHGGTGSKPTLARFDHLAREERERLHPTLLRVCPGTR